MEIDTFTALRLTAIALCSSVLLTNLAACSNHDMAAVKPATEKPVATADAKTAAQAPAKVKTGDVNTVTVEADSAGGEAESTLIDPTPERLVLGARYNQMDKVKYLLDGGMDVNTRDAYGNTALIAAAGNGHKEMVQYLLDHNAKVNASNKKDMTALMGAAAIGDYQLVHKLIKAGADVNAKNNQGETALFMAVQYGNYEAAKVILNGGGNPNISNTVRANFVNGGFTPLMYAATHGLTTKNVDWVAMAKLLLENGANPNLISNHSQSALNYARDKYDHKLVAVLKQAGAKDEQVYAGLDMDKSLLKAARTGDVLKMQKFLKDGADPNNPDKNGVLPLMAVAYQGNMDTLQALIENGAEPNFIPLGLTQYALGKSHAPLSEHELMAAASRGDSALHAAVRLGHVDQARYLIEHGARIDLTNKLGKSPLLVAAEEGKLEAVKLLLEKGADPNSVEADHRRNRLSLAKHSMGQNSALIVAVEQGHEDVAKALIEAGANVNYRGFLGKTALYVEVEHGQLNLAQKLLASKANANIKDMEGMSPLMEAARRGNPRMVADLINHKANVNAIEEAELGYTPDPQDADTSTGMTALMFAARSGHDKVVSQLLRAGASANVHNSNGKNARDMAAGYGYSGIVKLLAPRKKREVLSVTTVSD